MRKYFLLSAVALLATSTANATTDYAEVTAKATIEIATQLDCNDMDFGTIVVKQNNKASTVILNWRDGHTVTGDVLSYDFPNEGNIMCYYSSLAGELGTDFADSIDVDDTAVLTAENGATMTVTNISKLEDEADYAMLGGTLNIPANVTAGTYTGSFGVTVVY